MAENAALQKVPPGASTLITPSPHSLRHCDLELPFISIRVVPLKTS